MVQISGKYEVVKNEKLYEHLLARSVPEEHAKKIGDQTGIVMEVIHEGDKVTIKSSNISNTFVLNKEIVEKITENITANSTAVLNGDVLTISSKSDNASSGKRTFNFSANEVVITIEGDSDKIPVAKRFYKKL